MLFTGPSTPGVSDSDKVNLQVTLDVKAFSEQVGLIGEAFEPPIAATDVHPLVALQQRVSPTGQPKRDA